MTDLLEGGSGGTIKTDHEAVHPVLTARDFQRFAHEIGTAIV